MVVILFSNRTILLQTLRLYYGAPVCLSVDGVSILLLDIGKGKPESELAQKEAGSFGDRLYPRRITNFYQ